MDERKSERLTIFSFLLLLFLVVQQGKTREEAGGCERPALLGEHAVEDDEVVVLFGWVGGWVGGLKEVLECIGVARRGGWVG